MSGKSIGRAVCAAAVVAGLVSGPQAAAAPGPGEGSVAGLLADLQELYRKTEQATETYNATAEKLRKQRAEVKKLGAELTKSRTALHDSRAAAGRLARQQYQGDSELSPYLKLLLARDPRRVLDQGHVVRRLAAERVETVGRLVDREKRADALAARSRKALDAQVALAVRQKEDRDEVTRRLKDVEEMLADLTADELDALRRLEEQGTADAQRDLLDSGALGGPPGAPARTRAPSQAGAAAIRYAVKQIGKPYVWGAEGPKSFDCSGLTSRAWQRAGRDIPRTSQEQWEQLERVPLHRLRPGDLVVYFPEATHVALYLGEGKVVQAPRPGSRVKVSPIAANPLLGAVRPDPDGRPVSEYRPPRLPEGATEGSDLGYSETTAPDAD
ncbi:NlpC/P60 family protein [Streptomyces sp. LHD-70]|uniref:C40 family peptidase n=1 Tax=Streptomyces sp. LHD-70 TaxID=3072140 RepID=UPI00280CE815|nr:NlpC/P60 family protein [Streptomyces sp. LHD-70]MDQ8702133.1 NlpC/P60 family protein [Streptomyces sp. LHD-70]